MRHPVTGKWIEIVIDTHELAWAAGFFDGEGTSGCYNDSHGGNPILKTQVSQMELQPLKRYQKALLEIPGIYYNKSNGISYSSTGKFEKTQAVMAMLWKYLSQPKRDQYKRAIITYKELYNPNRILERNEKNVKRLRGIAESNRIVRIK